MPVYEINPAKIYNIPLDTEVEYYANKYIVIAVSFANWIVLDSMSQVAVLNYFKLGHSINEALEDSQFDPADVTRVVTEIEARQFCFRRECKRGKGIEHLHLHLTNECNLSCPHCYMYSGVAKFNELSTSEIIEFIIKCKQIAGITTLTLSGGEPTLHPAFDLIIERTSQLGIEIKLLTNGTMINSQNVDRLVKHINSVQVSIDGFSEESNCKIRGKGQFAKALNAVKELVTAGIETSVAITPSLSLLRNHTDEYVEFAKSLTRKYEGKAFSVKFAEGLSAGRTINPSKRDNDEYADLVKHIQGLLYNGDYNLITFVETIKANGVIDNCMFGSLAVMADGDVYLCADVQNLIPIANIRSMQLSQIVKIAQTAEESTSVSNIRPCNECAIRFICGGGCRTKEFQTLVRRQSFDNLDYDTVPKRQCSQKIKNRFYDLMIRSNEYLYSES